jgi:flagellar hook-basal body complex protein FliE
MSIQSLQNIDVPLKMPAMTPRGGGDVDQAGTFKQFLMDSIQEVNSMQTDANRAVENLMTGGDANPAEVLTAVQKADLAFRMMMQVRNKLLQAFQEVRDIRV